jgi:diacylglycerol O-acyltransferase / wax synthase
VPIDRLTQLDRVMLGASKTWPQDIGALVVLDGTPLLDSDGHLDLERIRRTIAARLHLVPRFRQRIVTPQRGLGGPFWVDDADFDLTAHIHQHVVRPPGGEAELIDAVELLGGRPLDPSRPLWEMSFLTGLPDGHIALFVRIHHTVADGMAAMLTLTAILDTQPDTPDATPRPWTPASAPTARDLFVDNVRRRGASIAGSLSPLAHPMSTGRSVRQAWPAVREILAEEPATATSLDRMVGPGRDLALIRTALDAVKASGHAYGATVNDVLLAVTTAGVRVLLQTRGEPVDHTTVRIYAPVSLRRDRSGPQQGNLIAQMAIPVDLGEADPVARLQLIAAETAKRKARTRTSLGVLMRGRIIRRLALIAVVRQRVNVASASIPGPPTPLYLSGARILEVFPLLPLIANEPLGIGALSYAGGLYIGIVVDRDAVPDLNVLAAAIGEELLALQPLHHPQPASVRQPTFERITP